MKRYRYWLIGALLLIGWHPGLQAQEDSIAYRILLVGDAGKLTSGTHPELDLLKSVFNLNDGHTAVLFLGDNIYDNGLPDSTAANYETKKKIIDNQVNAVRNTRAQAWFIPGNHDWNKGKSDGLEYINNQSEYIQSLQLPNVHFEPLDGCPGPVDIVLNEQVVLIIADSQWWLQQENRPGEESDCDCKSEADVLASLKELLYKYRDKLVIFAAHHPFKTHGEHGGYYKLKHHIFPLTEANKNLYIPLPVIGSIYPLGRSWFGNIQDLKHPVYKDYIKQVDPVLSTHPYCIRVAGHEHTLQWIQQNEQNYIVSGAGSKSSQVRKGKGTRFANEGPGFAALEIFKNGQVRLTFYSSQADNPQQPVYTGNLKPFVAEEIAQENIRIPALADSVIAIAAPYYKAGSLKKALFGKNYRAEWTQPIRVKVFDIGKELGGLKPTKRGGGFQSKSLRLEDTAGNEYVLRSIEKNPAKTLPEEFRETFVKDIVVDGISASYPYGALSVPPLADAAGVPHATPQLVYVPDDPRLKQYRPDFANGLYLFEERVPAGINKTHSTPSVLDKLQEDNDNDINQQAVLRARILDMFMMDFDRHEDQWRWDAVDNGKGKTYYPVPRDRDQVFFINNGIISSIISWPWLLPSFQGLRPHIKNINGFNFNARFFDRIFLTGLSEKDWSDEVDAFIPLMTDSVIEAALKHQPGAIYPLAAPWIVKMLKERRKFLKEEIMDYYRFLAKEVDVVGSDKHELFEVTRNTDGSVLVVVHKITKEGEQSKKLYERLFKHNETKEIRLWGMGGEDIFRLQGEGRKTIAIRIIGGKGKDEFDMQATQAPAGKTKVYDLVTKKNSFTGDGKWANKLSDKPEVNRLNRRAFKYNKLFPLLSVAYNPDDGIFLGLAFTYTKHGFRKSPFKVQHKLSVNHSLATSAYNFKYGFEAIDVFANTDFVLNTDIKAPDNTQNFFGIGNETVFDSKDKKIRYYRSRFNLYEASATLRWKFLKNMSVSAGPAFQHYSIDRSDNAGRFISFPYLNGLDSATVYEPKTYGGIESQLVYDSRNSRVNTARGINWQTKFRSMIGLGDNSNNYTQLESDISFYISFSRKADFVIATRFGGKITWGNYEFFQAAYLSGTDNLRGYRKYRYAGDKLLYHNIDLRLRIADFRGYIFPGSLGLVAFHDIGRVWVKAQSSSQWHSGFGGGLWLAPARQYVITACYAHSDDGGLPFVTLGFQF